jgi:hypothetical protein
MPTGSLAALLTVWQAFRPHLTRPGFDRMVVVAAGWVLTTASKHAITEALVVTGVAGKRHHEAFHRFFSRGSWQPDTLGLSLLWKLHKLGFAIRILLDDTLCSKKGPEVHGICSPLDPVRSTKAVRVFTFAHCWVVLCVVVDVPFSARPWALPVLFRLYRSKKHCANKGIEYRKKAEFGRELVDIVAEWFPAERIELSADCAYCNSTLLDGLAQNVVLFGSRRPEAVLTDRPVPQPRSHKGGRPAARGVPLPKPEELAADPSVPWKKCQALLYQQKRTVEYKAMRAQWYRGAGTGIVLIVITRCWTGKIPWRVYFCTDPKVTVCELLVGYARRWSIEVLFRELKQQFGFADSCARSKNAVLRTAPFVGMLYTTLVIWFIQGAHLSDLATPPTRPWYAHKQGLCFNDIVRTARRALVGNEVCVPCCDFNNLQNPPEVRPQPRKTPHRIAA